MIVPVADESHRAAGAAVAVTGEGCVAAGVATGEAVGAAVGEAGVVGVAAGVTEDAGCVVLPETAVEPALEPQAAMVVARISEARLRNIIHSLSAAGSRGTRYSNECRRQRNL
jgi:hypothetical protein